MTRDHLTAAELAAYDACTLAAADMLSASDHLEACEACRAQLLALAAARGSRNEAGEPQTNVSYEELAGWLNDELDPLTRRDMTAALEHSARARAELDDLTALRDEMNALPVRDHAGDATPPQISTPHFARWVFPLAAAVMLSAAAIWWVTSPRRDAAHFIQLRDGGRVIAFASDGRSPALASLPQSIAASIGETIRTGRIDVSPEAAALIGKTGTLASVERGALELRVLEPVGTAVREARPRFRWSAAPDASGYKINIVEETSGALVVSEQLPPHTTEWQPPQPLPSGRLYQWEIQAFRDGAFIGGSPKPPEPEARFRVLSEATLAELEEAKRASNGSHLVMAIANARAGLLDEAMHELRLLVEQNPEAELPRQLLQQLEAQRRPKQ